MTTKISFPLVLLLASIAAAQPACQFYNGCSFRFCDNKTTFNVAKNDGVFTGPICIKDPANIGLVQTGEAVVIDGASREFGRMRISQWMPSGLKQSFVASFFESYPIANSQSSGVGHQVPQGNQADFLNNKCWALDITEIEVIQPDGTVRKVDLASRNQPWKNCVAFRTTL